MAAKDNPFERYGLDPREGITAITQRLKELAQDATDEAEREQIREAWEELTLHPARRLRAALFAHPETRSPLGMPPSFARRRSTSSSNAESADSNPLEAQGLGLRDLAARPSVRALFLDAAQVVAQASSSKAATSPKAPKSSDQEAVSMLEDDPVLRGLG